MTQTDVPPFVSIVLAREAMGGGRGVGLAGRQALNFGFCRMTKTPHPCDTEGDPRWCTDTEEDP